MRKANNDYLYRISRQFMIQAKSDAPTNLVTDNITPQWKVIYMGWGNPKNAQRIPLPLHIGPTSNSKNDKKDSTQDTYEFAEGGHY